MGFIQKKDKKDEIDGIQVIGRGEGPDGVEENSVELVAGESAEHIAAGTTAAQAEAEEQARMVADADDEALKEGIEDADEDDEDDIEEESDQEEEGPVANAKLPRRHALYIIAAIACVVIAGIAGYFFGHGGFGAKGTGSATISEDQLDTPIASYAYNGKTYDVTAREVIEAQYSLDKAKNSDGKYAVPSSETVISYVRNQLLLKEAEGRGISVSSKERKAYAKNSIGTDDYSEMASSYGVTEDQAKQIVKENAIVSKLYQQVVGEDAPTAPTAPTQPADGNTETASKEYADYIINLAGDEWDSSKGTWASEDGPYAQALKDQSFTADSATYAQAQMAYYVAYQQYSKSAQSVQSKWSDFANGLYGKANLQIWGLYVG
ncbi:Uncharacterised protein [Collinsella sp. AK_207A]|uniref:hypothetical protein n=1 Tax=Collinsella sp. AK_207A TaxID=2650472 RepID=UPI0012612750|nr:hypothetical protein [Collinsella sp. AK_207A]VWL98826.1 Uncharacterised protein [Collinsella sp. AK_207A]